MGNQLSVCFVEESLNTFERMRAGDPFVYEKVMMTLLTADLFHEKLKNSKAEDTDIVVRVSSR